MLFDPDAPPHLLNSVCVPDCPIADLHAETLDILVKYPALYWKTKYSPCLIRQDERFIVAGTHQARARACVDAYLKREKAMGIFVGTTSIYRRFVEFLHYQFVSQFEIFPPELDMLSEDQKEEIARWNRRIFKRTLYLSVSDLLPILPIQMIWYISRVNPRYYGFSEERWNETPIGVILQERGMPANLLDRLVYSPNYWVRKSVMDNKNCSEESRIIGAILNLSGIPSSHLEPIY